MTDRGIVDALRRRGLRDLDVSDRARAEYSSDASLYRVLPAVVAFPRSSDEIAAALDACREVGVPLTMRGAGTSIAGNAVGCGVVLDTSRFLRRIHEIDPEARTARVDPGVVLADLQRAAAGHGLRFGPDPSTHDRCTIGGMIGNNACGSRALGYGRTSDNIVALTAVAGTGEPVSSAATRTALRSVVERSLAVIRTELGRFSRQVSGYALEHLLPENGFDVDRALVGSEGTCALVLDATVRLVPVPKVTRLVALGYPDMIAAADAVRGLLPLRPIAIEGLDERITEVVRRTRGARAVPALPRGGGWLFVEVAADDPADADAVAARVVAEAAALDSRVVLDPAEAVTLWRIREAGAGLAARPSATHRAHAGWEDSAVPPERLGPYLRDLDALLTQHGLTGVPYGHFGEGCVHLRIDLPLGEPARGGPDGGRSAMRAFLLDAAGLVVAHGGSLSGEHGDGRARSELLPRMYSPAALAAFAAVKAVFDPDGILNPGVLVDPAPLDADLRLPDVAPGDFAWEVHRCTGVGACRADRTASGAVMCPSYLATREEKDSTRGRARVLQELARGSFGPLDASATWRSDAVREALELCLACKGCSLDCPTGVDMAAYKAEVLYRGHRGRVRPMSDYALGWLPTWARLASRTPRLANAVLSSPLAAVGKRLAGVDARRGLPSLAPQTFRSWFTARRPTSTAPDARPAVLLFVDTFTDLFSPHVGQAAVRVLEAAGYSVVILDEPVCCGLTWHTTGQLPRAKRELSRAARALEPFVADGVPVVGLEPSCTATFREDGVAVRTLAELLAGTPGWTPPDLSDVEAVVQPHCHHHAVMRWEADADLLRSAGARFTAVGGCCGLAGSFGVTKGHYDVSVAVARTALLPAVEAQPDAVVLADGFSCRTQLSDLAHRPALHLAEELDPHRRAHDRGSS